MSIRKRLFFFLFFSFALTWKSFLMAEQAVSLVTGGAGFIGSHVTKELINLGHKVIVLDDLSGGYIEKVDPRAEFINGSILDYPLLEKLFKERQFDYVYHFAAYAAEGLSHFIRRYNYENNLLGTINLINLSVNHKIKCFVFTSSMSVYGSNIPPFTEDMQPHPEDPYAVSKYAAEMDLETAKEMFGLNYIIFRPHNVYGEYQNIADRYRNVIGIFMRQTMQGEKITIFGDGAQKRAFSYIGDIAPLIAKSIQYPKAYNEKINIGADQENTINELAFEVLAVMDVQQDLKYLPPRFEVKYAYTDHAKAREIFGDYKQTPLKEGLHKMATWAKSTQHKKCKIFANIEIEENLPKVWLEDLEAQ